MKEQSLNSKPFMFKRDRSQPSSVQPWKMWDAAPLLMSNSTASRDTVWFVVTAVLGSATSEDWFMRTLGSGMGKFLRRIFAWGSTAKRQFEG